MPTPTTINIVGGDGQTVSLGQPFAEQIACHVKDEFGNLMGNEGIVWSVPQTGPSGTFPTTGSGAFTTTTNPTGTGYSSLMSANNIAGSWSGLVQSTAVPAVLATFSVTNDATPVPTYLSTPNGVQKAAQNSPYAPLQVLVKDQFNAAMAGVTVTYTVPAGRGTWPGGGSLTRTAVTNGSGIATSPVLTASTTLGLFNIEVSAGSVSGTGAVQFTTIDASVVTSVSTFSGSGQSAAPSFPFNAPLVARTANALNAPVAGALVTFTSPAAGASCTFPTLFSTATAISDVDGMASSPIPTANATAGTYTVAATFPGATTAYFGLTNGGAPPATTDSLSMCEA